jgi:hypothetical protein
LRTSFKKVSVVAVLFAILAVSLVQIPQVHATKSSAQDKLQSFLTDVIGIDLTKYNVTQSSYGASYPSKYGGLVEEEVVSYTFSTNNGGQLAVGSIFYNGILCSCDFSFIQGPISYTQSPSASILDEAKSVIQKYQAYASQNCAIDTSYIQTAQGMLSSISELAPSTTLSGNMQLEITSATIEWIYTENGTAMPLKHIILQFQNDTLMGFSDYYGLYSVGCLSTISKDEAVALGLAAAESYNVSLVGWDQNHNLTVTYVKPDWPSNVTYDVYLNMVPGDSWMAAEITPPPGLSTGLPPYQLVHPSNVTRDPLALYPLWEMVFYFSKPVGDTVGVQVGIWGDSKEILFCSEYGYLGASTPSTLSPGASNQPSAPYASPMPSPPTSSAQSAGPTAVSPGSTPQTGAEQRTGSLGSALPSEYAYAAVCAIVAAIAIGSYLIIRRRR